jgi:FkbM family methyltransferase
MTPDEHPTFSLFNRWKGRVPAGFSTNFLGQMIDVEFLRGHGWATPDTTVDREIQSIHCFGDELFEWMWVLEAVLEAKKSFTMIELGAGFGRWLMSAACAAKTRRPDLKLHFIGVEAQPDHCKWMHKHFRDNGIDPREHRIIEAAVDTTSGSKYLVDGPDPSGWWGQYVTADGSEIARHVPGSYSHSVRTITLGEVVGDIRYIDLIDMDIQNSEKEVVPANITLLTERVRRAHVETHWPETHDICERSLREAGWEIKHSYPPFTNVETELGPVEFRGGGIIAAINPRAKRASGFLRRLFQRSGI